MVTVSAAVSLLDKIEQLVLNSPKVPLTAKVMVDEDKLFELLDKLREYLPAELDQAQQIISRRNMLLEEAQRRAEQMIEAAKRKSEMYVDESEIVRQAYQRIEEIKRSVEQETKSQRFEADKYSEQILAELEDKVGRALSTVLNGRQALAKTIETQNRR